MKQPRQNPAIRRLNVGFILARSFTLSAFALFVDTLRLAGDEADKSRRIHADWQVLGSTRHLITSSCGVQLAPTSDFIEPDRFDYIVVVGGLLTGASPIDEQTIAYLRRAAARNVPLIGLCTGTFLLAEAGLMKDHETCVSWLHYEAFRERFPDHRVRSDRLFNLDRARGSCAGGSSAVDIAAFIIRRCISGEAERNALEILQVEKARAGSDIQPRRPLSIDCDDPRLRAVLLMMETHTEDTISIPALAQSIGMSRRQLERLFMAKTKSTPAAIYQRVRLERARWLVTRTSTPMIDIALEAGFVNASHFSRVFRKTYGHAPTKLRSAIAD